MNSRLLLDIPSIYIPECMFIFQNGGNDGEKLFTTVEVSKL